RLLAWISRSSSRTGPLDVAHLHDTNVPRQCRERPTSCQRLGPLWAEPSALRDRLRDRRAPNATRGTVLGAGENRVKGADPVKHARPAAQHAGSSAAVPLDGL